MEPRIQYAQTADGVSIAYGTVGAGPPLVVVPALFEQFALFWGLSEGREFLEQLGKGRLLVLYDRRGFGLSERNVNDFSLEAQVGDLEAVVETSRLRRVALFASSLAGPTAIAYAARHRRQVSHLILYGTCSRAADVMPEERLTALIELCRANWDLAAQVFADMSIRQEYADAGLRLAEQFRESASGHNVAEWFVQGRADDVDHLLPLVAARVLVLHRRGDAAMPFGLGQKLAARLSHSHLIPLDGAVHAYFLGDSQAILEAIDSFLAEGAAVRARPPRPARLGFSTILFTDVEGSTALTQRLGDEGARQVLREHERIVREALKAHGGSEVKTMGDGFMASFSSATRALESAIAMQRAFAVGAGLAPPEGAASSAPTEAIRVRIGLNAGEPIAEEKDLFGTAVIVAARLAAQAQGGEILASDVVRQLVAGKRFLFSDRGEVALKGLEEPVRLYELRWREGGA